MDQQLCARIEQYLSWDNITTKNGNTQLAERNYIPIIIQCITELGGNDFKLASSQEPIDIQQVHWSDGSIIDYECKKVDSKVGNFHFNDTFIKDDVHYILIYGGTCKKIRIEKGSTLIKESKCVDGVPQIRIHVLNLGNIIFDMLSDNNNINSDNIKKFFKESFNFLTSSVIHGVVSYFDFGEMFKHTIKFGSFSSRPRPNWTLRIPYTELASSQQSQ